LHASSESFHFNYPEKDNAKTPVPKIDMDGLLKENRVATEKAPEQEPPHRDDIEQHKTTPARQATKRRSLLVRVPLVLTPRSQAISDAIGEDQSVASPDTVATRVARARRRSTLSSQVHLQEVGSAPHPSRI